MLTALSPVTVVKFVFLDLAGTIGGAYIMGAFAVTAYARIRYGMRSVPAEVLNEYGFRVAFLVVGFWLLVGAVEALLWLSTKMGF